MGIPNVMNTGRTGMVAAKASIATSGHNIANATTEGFSRQRTHQAADQARSVGGSHAFVGTGVLLSRVDRLNDDYIEKQIRTAGRDMAHMEEKDLALKQTEDIFNEMGGEGLNRVMSKLFNEFRKLGNDPDNEGVRQSVREASQAVVNDFHRLRKEVEDVRKHIDARMEGYVSEVNALANDIKGLNLKIKGIEIGGGNPNDLQDKRDLALKQLGTYLDLNMHKDNEGHYNIDITGVGPLVNGPSVEKFSVNRAPADDQGKPEAALELRTSASVRGNVTHTIKGGKIGALLEARDKTLSTVLDRLDDLAHTVATSINEIHRQGFTRNGVQGIDFFKDHGGVKERAAEFIELSDDIKSNVNNIATAAIPDAPGDNRIAIALSGLQNMKLMNEGKTSVDDYYNSIVSDVGVATASNRSNMNQQKDIVTQLNKMRDQISGVSIDEETTNLLQFQHAFDASAKVIQVADEMLKTVLELKRN